MSYAVTPTLSDEAFQARETVEEDLAVERRVPGAVGAWVSEPPPPGPSRLMSSA
jgi:hypothetical protein